MSNYAYRDYRMPSSSRAYAPASRDEKRERSLRRILAGIDGILSPSPPIIRTRFDGNELNWRNAKAARPAAAGSRILRPCRTESRRFLPECGDLSTRPADRTLARRTRPRKFHAADSACRLLQGVGHLVAHPLDGEQVLGLRGVLLDLLADLADEHGDVVRGLAVGIRLAQMYSWIWLRVNTLPGCAARNATISNSFVVSATGRPFTRTSYSPNRTSSSPMRATPSRLRQRAKSMVSLWRRMFASMRSSSSVEIERFVT